MKKQGQKDKEDEKLAMEVHDLKKDKVSKGNGAWIAHVRKIRKKGELWRDALKRGAKSYKKKK
jgi:hypothetical protein